MSEENKALNKLMILEQERCDWAEMLLAGDAMLGYVHELNNSLNSMMLQASVLEQKAGEAIRPEVALIRKLGKETAAKLAVFARSRERYRQMKTSVDLNQAIRGLFAVGLEAEVEIVKEFWPSPVTLSAHPVVLKQLISVMLRITKSWRKHGCTHLRTLVANDCSWLILEPASKDSKPPNPSVWTDLGEEDGDVLEILAAQSRARLVEAKLQTSVDAAGNRSLAAVWQGGFEATI
jgi:hypothetical protein